MGKPISVLIVEDSKADTALLVLELERHGYDPTHEQVEAREEMAAALDRRSWDVVIADHSMPRFNAPAALALMQEKGFDLPFIIYTGGMAEEAAVAAMRDGADDYVLKNDRARLIPAIERELAEAANRRARRRAEMSLRESEALKSAILEAALDAIITIDHDGHIIEFNPAAEAMFGRKRAEVIGQSLADLIIPSALREKYRQGLANYLATGRGAVIGKRIETTALRADGTEFPVEVAISRIGQQEPAMFAGYIRDLTEWKQAEARLTQLASVPEQNPNPIVELDRDWNVTYANPTCVSLFPGLSTRRLGHPLLEGLAAAVDELRRTRKPSLLRDVRVGQRYYQEVVCAVSDGTVRVFATDITDGKRVEEEAYQTQKMTAIEQLAGGIAHHFNNLMAGVMGFSELMLQQLKSDDPLRRYAEQIQNSADRAASLTRQLLAFSRNQPREFKLLDLNAILSDSQNVLRSLISDKIDLVIAPGQELWSVKADPMQMKQLLMNLVTNARDAMPDRGTLTVETANVTLTAEFARENPETVAGEYVMLGVGDTGSGMTEEVKAHMFEPFFTTKELGKATGLGLSICYGIVKQSGGAIKVSSAPNRGTMIRIYLPRVSEPLAAAPASATGTLPIGTKAILVAEDEPFLRELVATSLREQGYHVLEAGDGVEALQIVQGDEGRQIDLLVTGGRMPKMGGRELGDHFRALKPNSKVLYITGSPENMAEGSGRETALLLEKPFTLAELTRKVKEMLGS